MLRLDSYLRNPASPDLINPIYDLGDHIHPNPLGYAVMGESIDLAILENIAEWAVGGKH